MIYITLCIKKFTKEYFRQEFLFYLQKLISKLKDEALVQLDLRTKQGGVSNGAR